MKRSNQLLADIESNLKKKKKKKKSISSITEKPQITIITKGDDGEEAFNPSEEKLILYRCQQNNKSEKKGKGVVELALEPEHIDVDQSMETHCQEEILMDILKRLPVRSLLRFKCVSKFWNALISDPYFKTKQLSHAKNDKNSQKLLTSEIFPGGISPMYCCHLSSVQLTGDVQKHDFPTSFIPWGCRLLCCCDGLIIVLVIDKIPDRRFILLLWNPSTRESIVLPDLKVVEYCRLGLGYDSSSGDYKILKINNNIIGHRASGEILALKDGRWRNIDKHPLATWSLLHDTSSLPIIHGAFHWIGVIGESDVVTERKFSLVSFSISNEMYGEIPLPEQVLCPTRIFRIGISVLNEMLCVYSTSVCQSEAYKLWVLKNYGVEESWNLLFTISDPWICDLSPKYWFADGTLLYWCRYVQSRGTACRTSRGPFVLLPHSGDFGGIVFTESLISPKSLISFSLI